MSTTTKHYAQLEARIRKGDLDALLARWEFGRKLLAERDGAKRLPNGRLEQLANALASSMAELKNRMQFAEQYQTKAAVRSAFTKYGSWSAICARGMGDRGTSTSVATIDVDVADLIRLGILKDGDLDALGTTMVARFVDALRRSETTFGIEHAEEVAAEKHRLETAADPAERERGRRLAVPEQALMIDRAGLRTLARRAVEGLSQGDLSVHAACRIVCDYKRWAGKRGRLRVADPRVRTEGAAAVPDANPHPEEVTDEDDVWWESAVGCLWEQVAGFVERSRWMLQDLQRRDATVDERMFQLLDQLAELYRSGMEVDKAKMFAAPIVT